MLANATAVDQATALGEGFQKFGPYLFGLCLAIVALSTLFSILLHVLFKTNRDLQRQLSEAVASKDATQERRIADRDTFQTKMDSLGRETNKTIAESSQAYFKLNRTVQEKIPDPKKRAPPKDDPIFEPKAGDP
jgi:hypothetical protein